MTKVEHAIVRWVSIIYRYGQSYVGKKLERYNIGSGQYIILLILHMNDGRRQEELSDYLKIDKGSIAKSIKKLEQDGYVKRSVDEEDKRANRVFLTQKALDIIPEIKEAINSWEDTITSGLSESEKRIAEQLLHKMAATSDKLKEPEET